MWLLHLNLRQQNDSLIIRLNCNSILLHSFIYSYILYRHLYESLNKSKMWVAIQKSDTRLVMWTTSEVAAQTNNISTTVLKTHQVVAPAVEMAVGFPATRQGKQKVFGLSFL